MSNFAARIMKLENMVMLLSFQLKNLHGITQAEEEPSEEVVAWLEPIQGRFYCRSCGVPEHGLSDEELLETAGVDRESLHGKTFTCETCGCKIS